MFCRIFPEFYPWSSIASYMLTHLPHSLIAWACSALLALFRSSRSAHPSLAALLVCKDLHGCNLAQVSLRRDKLPLAGNVVIACRGWYGGNISWCWPLPAGKAIFMRVCKSKCIVSAASEMQCNIKQWWKKEWKLTCSQPVVCVGIFWGESCRNTTLFVLYRCSDISCTQMGC